MIVMKLTLIILLYYSFVFAQAPPISYNAITDGSVYTEPALTGALDLSSGNTGGRGSNYSFNDPTFNKKIIRITDDKTETIGVGNNRSFRLSGSTENIITNTDDSMIWLFGQGGEQLFYSYSPTTQQFTRVGDTTSISGGIWLLSHTGSNFSLISNKILWNTYNYKLRKYDFTSVTSASTTIPYTEIVDFGSIYNTLLGSHPNASYSGSDCSVDSTDTWVTVALGGDGLQDTWRLVIVYNISTAAYFALDTKWGTTGNTRVYSSATSTWTNTSMYGQWGVHNVKLDRSGTYINLSNDGTRPLLDSNQYIWIFSGMIINNLPWAEHGGGHKVSGFGSLINSTSELPNINVPSWWKRPLNNLSNEAELILPRISTTATDYYDDHAAWANVRNNELQPIFISTIRPTSPSELFPWRKWDRELIALSMDGSTVYRFAHHHDIGSGSFRVFGNVGQAGTLAFFTSNWGGTLGTGRDDVFAVIILEARKCNWNTNPICN